MLKKYFTYLRKTVRILFLNILISQCNCTQPLKVKNKVFNSFSIPPTSTNSSTDIANNTPKLLPITKEEIITICENYPLLGNLLTDLQNKDPHIDVNKIDLNHYNQTVLHQAAELGDTNIVKTLLAIPKIDIDKKDTFQDTPLHLAINKDKEQTVKLLLQKGAEVDQQAINLAKSISMKNLLLAYNKNTKNVADRTFTPITREMIQAAMSVYYTRHSDLYPVLSKIRKYPDFHENLNIAPYVSKDGKNLLYQAVLLGKKDSIISVLIEKGVNLNLQNENGYTPLALAIMQSNNPDAAKLLINYGAKTNIVDKLLGRNPLHWAAIRQKDKELIQLLIDTGININQQDNNGETPLTLAYRANNIEVANLLVQSGASINTT